MSRIEIQVADEQDSPDYEDDQELPAADFAVIETENEIELRADVAGYDEDDIEVTFDRGRLKVLGRRETTEVEGEEDDRDGEWIGFSDSFELPHGVGPGQIAVDLGDDGKLVIRVCKHERRKLFDGGRRA